MSWQKISIVALCLSLIVYTLAQAQKPTTKLATTDWPTFRGTMGDGIVREANWNPQLTPAPTQRWTVQVGIGFSSCAVVGNKVVTLGHDQGHEYVWCLDLASGKNLWSYKYPCALIDNLHEGGPAATPTIDGEFVYTMSKEGHLLCLGMAKGNLVWGQDLQKTLGTKTPDWGFACTPLIHGNLVIVEAGKTAAFDKKTGKPVWETTAYKPGYGSLTAFTYQGKTLLAALNNQFLIVVDAATGKELAQHRWETNYATSACTPIVSGNQIFVSTGYGQGSAMFQFDGSSLTQTYANKELRSHMATPILSDGLIYGIDGQSDQKSRCQLVCLDWATGQEKWSQRGTGCGTLLLAGKSLVVLTDAGEIVIAEANGEKYTELGRFTAIDGKCWTVPTLTGNALLVRNAAGKLVCWDLKK